MVNAVAVITGTNGRKGTVSFSVEGSGPTTVKGSLSGLPPGNHALIIHTYGNIGNDWVSTGPPFKPAGADGFLENITVTSEGIATFEIYKTIPLSGNNSVIGRGLVVHASPSPDPGDGVAWGTIGLSY
ncbi:hypothetical protein AB3S75_012405 [Citrus x aurantiifolia]